jgi:hypothetical protein
MNTDNHPKMRLLAAVTAMTVILTSAGCERKEVQDPVARGAYLAATSGCEHCHTPMKMGAMGPEPDMSMKLAGHPEGLVMPPPPALPEGPWMWIGGATGTAFAGPWGVSYSPNLTPDSVTGFAIWTEEMFLKAMRTGKHMGTSRPIMPPMPWDAYGKMTDDDLKAIYAYLRTVPPVRNQVPDYQPPPEIEEPK